MLTSDNFKNKIYDQITYKKLNHNTFHTKAAMASEKIQSKHVCVIGAGPAGLVSARELRKEGHSVVVFEQKHDIGGQWLYDDSVECEDPLGRITPLKVHSSIYPSLRFLHPREITGFSDFPFTTKRDRDTRRYPGHRELYLYLKDFCDWFKLAEIIRFNTRVEYVGQLDDSLDHSSFSNKWVVRAKDLKSENVMEEVFDAVVVASGHYSQPRMPDIRGMDKWKRKQIHSHVYRIPEPYRNEVVVVVGNSYSGLDISLELLKVAKEIHLSMKSFNINEALSKIDSKYQNLHLHLQIDSLLEDGKVVFVDGSSVIADSIIYCTGYSYSFPFLDTKGVVSIEDDRVGPLYEHTFPPSLAPSLSFAALPRKIGPPFFESQAKWISQILSGKLKLPSFDQMMKVGEEFYKSREIEGIPKRNTHDIDDIEYWDKVADFSGHPHLEEWRKELSIISVTNLFKDYEAYREQWDDRVGELIKEAYQSPHFTQMNDEADNLP